MVATATSFEVFHALLYGPSVWCPAISCPSFSAPPCKRLSKDSMIHAPLQWVQIFLTQTGRYKMHSNCHQRTAKQRPQFTYRNRKLNKVWAHGFWDVRADRQTDRYTDILLLLHHLSQEGIHTSCIKHSVRIQKDRIYSLNELLMYGTHCLLMLTFPHCPGSNNLLSELIFHSFYRTMLCIRGTSHGPMSVSVRLSQVGVLLLRLNTGSHKQHHTIPQRL